MTPLERLFSFLAKPWVVFLYLLLVSFCFFYLDKPIAEYFFNLKLRQTLPIVSWITHLGSSVLYLSLLPVFACLCLYIRKIRAYAPYFWFLWCCVLVPGVVCMLLKVLLGRARPGMWLEEGAYGFYGMQGNVDFWSFPSGHTTTIMGLMLGLGLLFPRYWKPALLLGVLVASSRIFLVQHYLSDVLIAMYLTAIEIKIMLHYSKHTPFLTLLEKKS